MRAQQASVILLLLLSATNVQAQSAHACIQGLGTQNERIWWTGAANGKYLMNFVGGAPVLSNAGIGQTGSFEGTAVYTTAAGALLLYTDGDSIFNGQTNALIGTGVGGNVSATEAAQIVPVPAGVPTNDFYVFGNSTNVTPAPINFTKVNISANTIGPIAALGGGVAFGESLGVVPAANGTDFWILSVTGANPAVNAYLVTAAGVAGSAVSAAVPSLPAGTTANRGTLIYHPPTRQLAFSFYSTATGTGYIYTATFDEFTGMTSGFVQQATGQLGYSVAFSPDGSKLYYSVGVEGYSGTLTQKDLTTSVVSPIAAGSWAMPRLAPDGRIYVVGFGQTTMGVINSPDGAFPSIGWAPTGVTLPAGATSGFALVNQTYAPCSVNGPAPTSAVPLLGPYPLSVLVLLLGITGVASMRGWRGKA